MEDPLIRIQGAGPVGILTALFLVKYGWTPSAIELVDPALHAPQPAHDKDPRILALSHGTLVRLHQLNIPVNATRIQHIHVSSQGHFGSMEIRTERVGVSDLGGLLGYASLLTALREAIRSAGVDVREGPSDRTPGALVIAEGGLFQRGAAMPDPGMQLVRDYHQNAVIGWVTSSPPPADTAWERFTDDGVMLLHTIGKYGKTAAPDPFTDKWIFPGYHLPSISQLAASADSPARHCRTSAPNTSEKCSLIAPDWPR